MDSGVGVGANGIKAKFDAGIDLVSTEAKLPTGQEFRSNLGVNVDTGAEIRDWAVSASVAEVGGTFGRTMGIKTPIGGFSFKLW